MITLLRFIIRTFALGTFLLFVPLVMAEDWPTYMHDNSRSAVTKEQLTFPLKLQWMFLSQHRPQPAWSDPPAVPEPLERNLELPRLDFDKVFHVISAFGKVYFGSSADNHIYCLDADTGNAIWRFCTDGPIRFAPTFWEGKLYVGSDDGFVYCLDAKDGSIVWKFQVSPGKNKVLGNGRLVSLWPVRTGVLVDKGVAYFGAGLFPDEGVFLYAVDAKTGVVIWGKNVHPGIDSQSQRNANAATVSPQGYMLASETKLFVPCGRMCPAVFNRENGDFLYQPGLNWMSSWHAKGPYGGTYAIIDQNYLYNGTEQILVFNQDSGKFTFSWPARQLAFTEDFVYMLSYAATQKQEDTAVCLMAIDRNKYLPKTETPRFKLAMSWDNLLSHLMLKQHLGQLRVVENSLDDLDVQLQKSKKQLSKLELEEKEDTQAIRDLRDKITSLSDLIKQLTETRHETIRKLSLEQAKLDSISSEEKGAVRKLEAATKWSDPNSVYKRFILAGNTVFAGGDSKVTALSSSTGKQLWSERTEGDALDLAVANGALIVSTDEGKIYCFASKEVDNVTSHKPQINLEPYPSDMLSDFYKKTAASLLDQSGIKRGYALILGAGDGHLAYELARQSELLIYFVEPDEKKVKEAKKKLLATGLYGTRITAYQGSLEKLSSYPDYFANLIVCESSFFSEKITPPAEEVLRMLKPYGGVAFVGQPNGVKERLLAPDTLKSWLKVFDNVDTDIIVKNDGSWAQITRGPIHGGGTWTHEYGNAANTGCSNDAIVKGPIGVLWYGEPGPGKMRSRHSNPPGPLSINGKMFIQGRDVIMAYDAYNGLFLWETQVPAAGEDRALYIPWYGGYKPRGSYMNISETSNLAASEDRLFVAVNNHCLELDANTGQIKRKHNLPIDSGTDNNTRWGYVAFNDNLLFGSCSSKPAVSDRLFSIDITTGKLKWVYKGRDIRHQAIAIGDGKVFLCDDSGATDSQKTELLQQRREIKPRLDRRGNSIEPNIRLVVALDQMTGQILWQKPVDVTDYVKLPAAELTAIYSQGILLLSGAAWNGHLTQELLSGKWSRRSIMALSAQDGNEIWSNQIGYHSRPLVVGDTIYAEPWAYNLFTGEAKTRLNPITGLQEKWQMAGRTAFCGPISASLSSLFFRSWSLAYYDLVEDIGITSFRGFRPGCTNNIMTAGGIVIIPEGAVYCLCHFPLQTTIVLHPVKRVQPWGQFSLSGQLVPLRHLAINLGTTGDRRDEKGNLWIGYCFLDSSKLSSDPFVLNLNLECTIMPGGKSYRSDKTICSPANLVPSWVFSSGIFGLTRCSIPINSGSDKPVSYTVRLGFIEPEHKQTNKRIFSIRLQNQLVLENFDVFKEAGGSSKAVVKEFKNVVASDNLTIELVPKVSGLDSTQMPVLSFIEILANNDLPLNPK